MKFFLQEYMHEGILPALYMILFIYNFSPWRLHSVDGKLVTNIQYICGLCFDVQKYIFFFFLLLAFFSSTSLTLQGYGDMKTEYVAGKYGEWVHYQN